MRGGLRGWEARHRYQTQLVDEKEKYIWRRLDSTHFNKPLRQVIPKQSNNEKIEWFINEKIFMAVECSLL